ncbi:ABC transporter permease [Nocardioides acrostichi]|uniref:ABC transporter permease subunit n=1 Tax=Nocardioides acrostichi TaxID=2784339 RepID=A0A930UYA0_9ACTN|nr:ABC transporter permease subunit [Nocardioides acrostichi]MBF4160215.1 ABC transporter permease subunit [Nocardioides acrostichi]
MALTLSPERARTVGTGAAAIVVVVTAWWVLAATVLAPYQIPTPGEILAKAHDRGFGYYRSTFAVTLHEASRGYLYGVAIALGLAVLVLLVPWLEPLVMQFAVVTYCLPIVVLAPILIILLETATSTSPTATALAGLSVVFTTVVGAILGFRSADKASLDVVSVYGGGPWQQFRRVRLVASLPALFTTLQIAAPAAFLGALLGEWFDRHLEVGVGPSLYLAMNNRETALAWSLGLGCALVSGVAYAAIGLVAKLLAPWSSGVAR